MDVVVEYLIKKQKKPVDYLITVGYIVAAVVVFFAGTFIGTLSQYLSMIGVIIGVGAIYLAYRLISARNIEYEYSIVNGEMDVDKIIARKKRRRILTLRLLGVSSAGKYNKADFAGQSFDSEVYVCEDPDKDNSYYMVFDHRDFGHCLMVLTPSERLLEAMHVYIPQGRWK